MDIGRYFICGAVIPVLLAIITGRNRGEIVVLGGFGLMCWPFALVLLGHWLIKDYVYEGCNDD